MAKHGQLVPTVVAPWRERALQSAEEGVSSEGRTAGSDGEVKRLQPPALSHMRYSGGWPHVCLQRMGWCVTTAQPGGRWVVVSGGCRKRVRATKRAVGLHCPDREKLKREERRPENLGRVPAKVCQARAG